MYQRAITFLSNLLNKIKATNTQAYSRKERTNVVLQTWKQKLNKLTRFDFFKLELNMTFEKQLELSFEVIDLSL